MYQNSYKSVVAKGMKMRLWFQKRNLDLSTKAIFFPVTPKFPKTKLPTLLFAQQVFIISLSSFTLRLS